VKLGGGANGGQATRRGGAHGASEIWTWGVLWIVLTGFAGGAQAWSAWHADGGAVCADGATRAGDDSDGAARGGAARAAVRCGQRSLGWRWLSSGGDGSGVMWRGAVRCGHGLWNGMVV
jgi:hypothetical protein